MMQLKIICKNNCEDAPCERAPLSGRSLTLRRLLLREVVGRASGGPFRGGSVSLGPVAERGLHQSERRHGGGVRSQNARPEREADEAGLGE